jgi:GT2 family glycosyltransferase
VINLETVTAENAPIEVSVIMVTYGARELTMRSLQSIAREICHISAEVIIVDNDSPDGMADEIVSRHPDFHVLPQTANTGFAAAANSGAEAAKGGYLMFLNPDTLMLEGAAERLLEFARRRPRAGIWGGQTLFDDGRINPTSCRRSSNLWRLFCSAVALDTRFPDSELFASAGYGGWDRSDERAVEVICGSFMLVQRALWDRLGGFSPAFFMYGEDEELCIRARKLGYAPVFSPQPVIIHSGSGTERNQDRKIRHLLAARALLIRGYFSTVARPLALVLLQSRPWLGRWFAQRALRTLWRSVWSQRRLWLAGQFG